MTLGSGGVLVELLKDSATLLLPVSGDEVETALRGLKLFPLLDGYRGRPKADVAAAISAVLALAAFVQNHAGEIEELDINPLIVCAEGQGAWVADALSGRRRCLPKQPSLPAWQAPPSQKARKSAQEPIHDRICNHPARRRDP